MKVHRIRVERFRKFDKPIEVIGLEPGLNVLYGPNEAGKSTIASALRTLFLEKHNTKGESFAKDIATAGAGSCAPMIAADFSLSGEECHASKTFLVKPRAQFTLGNARWEGSEADEELATRLGFTLAGKGASRPETQGIPGLLWIQQGTSADLEEPIEHAASSLAERLKCILGDLASTSGGQLKQALDLELGKLRTKTGRSTGLLDDTEKLLADAVVRRDALRDSTREYQGLTDSLSRDLADEKRLNVERPWDGLEREKRAAEAQVAALEPQQRELEASRQSLRELNARRDTLHAQLEVRTNEVNALAGLRNKWAEFEASKQHVSQAMQQVESDWRNAKAARTTALAQLQVAQTQAQHEALQSEIVRCQAEISTAEAILQRAQAFQDDLTALRQQAGALQLSKKDLAQIETLDRDLRETRIQHEAVATRVVFRIKAGQSILTGTDHVLEGDGSLRITEPLTLQLAGLGEIDIVPGGEDIARLANETSRLEEALATLCARVGVSAVADAQARFARLQDLTRVIELKALERTTLLSGVEESEWQAKLAQLRGRLNDLQQRLAGLPEVQAAVSVEEAQRCSDDAEAAWVACEEQYETHRQTMSRADLEGEELQGRIRAAAERLEGEAAERLSQQLTRELTEAIARCDGLQERIGNAEAELARHRPDDLAADIQRLTMALDLLGRQRSTLQAAIAGKRGQLASLGAQGLDEKLAAAEIEADVLERRLVHYRLRADALTLLCSRLATKQEAAVQRLYAPLRLKLDRYLRQLFPAHQVGVEIDGLRPTEITRGKDVLGLEQHSHGTREQLGVIARFAYADLLKDAGQPTLVVLDDALVHSDAERRQQMKRILHDAAQRHQVLLFTCHPEYWRDAGAQAMIDVAALRDCPAG